MEVPLEISYRGLEKNPTVENLIRRKVAALERVCDYIISCNVSIERSQQRHRTGNPYLVRIDIKVPPGHEIVVKRTSTVGPGEEPLTRVLRRAFDSARRQLDRLVEQQRGEVKVRQKSVTTALEDTAA
jgi:ribosome-associated translation inhibitor RaiA